MRLTIELSSDVMKDGRRPIMLVMVHHGRARYPVGMAVDPKAWDRSRRQVRFGVTGAFAINARIEAVRQRAEALAMEHPEWTPAQLRDALKGPDHTKARLLLTAIKEDHDRQAHRLSYGTRKGRLTVLKDVEQAIPLATLTGIKASTIMDLDRYFHDRGLATNTRRSRLRRLRTMYRSACRAEGIEPVDVFRGLIPAEVDTGARHLTDVELAALKGARCHTPAMELAKDAWLLSYYLGGVRFGDLCRLSRSMVKDGAVTWTAGKVPRPRWAPIGKDAAKIIARHKGDRLLPLIPDGLKGDAQAKAIEQANATVNRSLKDLAALAGLPTLTMHMARHTWAQAAKAATHDLHAVSRILGHARTSTTERYLSRFDRDAVGEVFAKVAKAGKRPPRIAGRLQDPR